MGHTGGPNHAMRCGGSESCTWVSCGATGWVSHMGSWCAAAMDPIEILDMKARGALPQAGQAPHACSLADTGKARHPYFTGKRQKKLLVSHSSCILPGAPLPLADINSSLSP